MHFELTKDSYIKMKKAGLSDEKIAKVFGVRKTTITYRKRKWGLVNKGLNEKPKSLCWYCKRSRPSLCKWIATGEPIFQRAEKSLQKSQSHFVEVVLVKECKDFLPMKDEEIAVIINEQ